MSKLPDEWDSPMPMGEDEFSDADTGADSFSGACMALSIRNNEVISYDFRRALIDWLKL